MAVSERSGFPLQRFLTHFHQAAEYHPPACLIQGCPTELLLEEASRRITHKMSCPRLLCLAKQFLPYCLYPNNLVMKGSLPHPEKSSRLIFTPTVKYCSHIRYNST